MFNTFDKGMVVEGFSVRNSVVYAPVDGGRFFVPCGILTKEEYTWGRNVDVPDMDNVTLVVLDYYQQDNSGAGCTGKGICFGMKHLTPRIDFIKKFIAEADDSILEHMYDIWNSRDTEMDSYYNS